MKRSGRAKEFSQSCTENQAEPKVLCTWGQWTRWPSSWRERAPAHCQGKNSQDLFHLPALRKVLLALWDGFGHCAAQHSNRNKDTSLQGESLSPRQAGATWFPNGVESRASLGSGRQDPCHRVDFGECCDLALHHLLSLLVTLSLASLSASGSPAGSVASGQGEGKHSIFCRQGSTAQTTS